MITYFARLTLLPHILRPATTHSKCYSSATALSELTLNESHYKRCTKEVEIERDSTAIRFQMSSDAFAEKATASSADDFQ